MRNESAARIRRGSFVASGFALLARAIIVISLSFFLSFPLLFAPYLEADTNAYVKPGSAIARALHRRWSNKTVSDTREKHCCLANSEIRTVVRRGIGWEGEEVTKYRRAGITLRFLPHCAVRRRSFRRTSCPRLVGGNIEKVSSLSSSLSLSLSSFFLRSSPHRGSLPHAGFSYRTAKTTQLPDTPRGISRATQRENERNNNSFCSFCRQPRLCARWFILAREMKRFCLKIYLPMLQDVLPSKIKNVNEDDRKGENINLWN